MAVFLTDDWFNEVDRLTSEAGDLNMSPALADMALNLTITDTAQGDVEAHLANGSLKKGHTDAPTTIKLNEKTLGQIAQDGNFNSAMGAFMSGDIRIEGDMSQMMTLQSAKISNEQKDLYKKIYAMTEQA